MKTTGIFLTFISVILVVYALSIDTSTLAAVQVNKEPAQLESRQRNLTITGTSGLALGIIMTIIGYARARRPRKTIDE